MKNIEYLITELGNRIPEYEKTNNNVSNSSIGWHIEHSLLSIKLIIEALKNSDPDKYKWKFNKIRTFVLTMKKIPRGKAQAPDISIPENTFDKSSLKDNLKKVKTLLEDTESLNPNQYIEHPFFGDMNLRQSKKLLYIHTKHHLDIINDIISKKN